jgi:RNA polymerase sigma-70 factor (ECF subfamily)
MADADFDPQQLATLAERIRQGDSSAENEFARLFSEKVLIMNLARVHDREAARDLTQETMLAVLRALRNGHIREPERLGGFVHGTALNLIHNHLRARFHEPKHQPLPDELASPDLSESAETVEQRRLVERSLQRLDPIDRRILLLTLVEGMKPREIARNLGLKPECVRQRKSRAVKKVIEQVRKLSRKRTGKPLTQVGAG